MLLRAEKLLSQAPPYVRGKPTVHGRMFTMLIRKVVCAARGRGAEIVRPCAPLRFPGQKPRFSPGIPCGGLRLAFSSAQPTYRTDRTIGGMSIPDSEIGRASCRE